jgi:hypothetical protein
MVRRGFRAIGCIRTTEFEDLLMSKLGSPEDRPKIVRHHVSRGIIKGLVAAGFGLSLIIESDNGAMCPD